MAEKPRELTDAPKVKLPRAAARIAQAHPELWQTYQRLGELVGAAGPLEARERRLIHLAYALGSASEGAAHSHARRALSEGISEAELEHVAILSATTLGWPRAIRALTIVQDVTDAGKDTADQAAALVTWLAWAAIPLPGQIATSAEPLHFVTAACLAVAGDGFVLAPKSLAHLGLEGLVFGPLAKFAEQVAASCCTASMRRPRLCAAVSARIRILRASGYCAQSFTSWASGD